MTRPFVIALDGPAAAGKGTLARLMADAYALAHLDTGILYRGVAYLMLKRGEDPNDLARAVETAKTFTLESLSGADLRTREVSAAASVVAANPGVRSALLAFQRDFANVPQPGMAGAVLDGRDIGTVVCPDADIKFFVVARDEVRAKRRWLELIPSRPTLTLEDVRADLAERDARDIARGDAPLVKAADAELIDTSDLSIEAAFATARRLIDRVFRRCGD